MGQLVDIFMQAVPIKVARPPKLQAWDNRTEVTQYKIPVHEEGKKGAIHLLQDEIGEKMVDIKGKVSFHQTG